MEEINGYIGERQGVRVVVVKEPYRNMSDYDMMKIAVDLIQEDL